jgi:hypothetical protein
MLTALRADIGTILERENAADYAQLWDGCYLETMARIADSEQRVYMYIAFGEERFKMLAYVAKQRAQLERSFSTAIAVMHATRTLHPPGGATALIAIIGSPQIHDLGFFYVLVPVTLGALILLAVALVVNNLPKSRRYPEVWF